MVIVCDGQMASVVTFSARINPTGCRVETYGSMKSAAATAGFPLCAPAQPWLEVLNVDALMKNIGPDTITSSKLETGIVRCTYSFKDSKLGYADFDIDPTCGNNVTSKRIFAQPSVDPVATCQLSWERKNSVWFVKQFDASQRYSPSEVLPYWQRSVVTFDSFAPNALIAKKVFAIESLPIPPGTQTLDRTR